MVVPESSSLRTRSFTQPPCRSARPFLPGTLGVRGVNEDAPLLTAARKAALELSTSIGDHQLWRPEGGHPAL
eukprot:10497290-Alexandrium_andersonii.AAC.1